MNKKVKKDARNNFAEIVILYILFTLFLLKITNKKKFENKSIIDIAIKNKLTF
ncbi:hypothetical protein [Providencia alcalifaciens]|jgi:hypothetical protein|uniref:hypothetical protein n=1 Tax=Providencia alcalifaciens TaxID=126385 RepID=UPI0018C7D137|nr:hypothetical protein [Providencia alcalifaciens]MBG5884574.1 hypothetical protein [Providencia alcalifaciens]MDR2243649.1 hypothetical protein [Providencia alcalifaciens]